MLTVTASRPDDLAGVERGLAEFRRRHRPRYPIRVVVGEPPDTVAASALALAEALASRPPRRTAATAGGNVSADDGFAALRRQIDARLFGGAASAESYAEREGFAVALSHDVDYLAPGWRERLWSRQLAGGRERGRAGAGGVAAAVMDLESEYGFRSTFFYYARVPKPGPVAALTSALFDPGYGLDEVADDLRAIRGRGFEVGLHGSVGAAAWPELLAAEKRALEQRLGGPVTSNRFHCLAFTPGVTEAGLAASGVTADSTLGPIRATGFLNGTACPFALAGGEPPVLEVPLAVMDITLFRYQRLAPVAAVRETTDRLETVRRHCGAVAIDWHSTYLNPAFADGEWLIAYRDVLGWIRDHGGRGVTVGEVAAAWA